MLGGNMDIEKKLTYRKDGTVDLRSFASRPNVPIIMISPNGENIWFDSVKAASEKMKELFPDMKSSVSSMAGNISLSADTDGKRKVRGIGFRRLSKTEMRDYKVKKLKKALRSVSNG
jgi:hypothetical protein